MMKFTEAQLEQVFIELLEKQGFSYTHGGALDRDMAEVLIVDDLKNFLASRYKKEGITGEEIDRIVRELQILSSTDLYASNKTIMKMVSDGFILKREDRSQKDLYIELIDYNGLTAFRTPDPEKLLQIVAEENKPYGHDRNIYKFVNQLEILGYEKRIPDGIAYINGLPLVVFEFKTAIREETTIHDAYVQLSTRYRRDIPELLKYNAFCVISDGVNNRAGSLFAPYEFFYSWRRVEGLRQDVDGIDSLYTLIEGMFDKDRFREIIRDFIYIPDTSRKEEKIVCRYPQYYAATKLYDNILEHQKPDGDGKGGTYFGATGCGKSFTMLFLTRLLMRSKELSSPTIVLITDRTDLDDQLSEQFTNAKGYVGDDGIISVESRAELRERLQGRKSGGVFLTTIHKFTEDTKLLTDRANVICISDEAHRSQTNLDQKIRVTDKGVTKSYGFAKYLHDSLPYATFVGFTGTPVDATLDVFGKVIDSYTMTESVKDEITVPIVYEGRAAKVMLDNRKLHEIEDYYNQCAEEGTNEYQIEESKRASSNLYAILGDHDRLRAMAEDFVKHYENRIAEGSTIKGKAMFVCANRNIAYAFYKNVVAYLGERSSSSVHNYAAAFTKHYGEPEEWHSGNLPHRNKTGLLQFVTFRLADSLPKKVLDDIENQIKNLKGEKQDTEKRKQFEKYLDSGYGSCALKHPEMARIVIEALQYHDGDKYDLLAWSIMPNHVHILIKTNDELPKIVQSWKSFTGKWAIKNNRKYKLGISHDAEKFWMPEYWDRFIRDEGHFNNTIRYILNNPKKANLKEGTTAYRFTGCVGVLGMKHELHPTQQKLLPYQIKLVMTRGKDDEKELYDMLGSKEYRKELDRQFKNEKSNFKIAIVVDMWLTGFDVPFLDTMYIDKPIQRHNLIQTISRVNRKFRDKEKGLVVDYIGIKKQMNMALAHYNKGDRDNFEDVDQSVTVIKDHLDLLGKIFHKFDNSGYFSGNAMKQLHTLNMAAEYVQITQDIEKRFMHLVKRMKAAYDICSGSEKLNQK